MREDHVQSAVSFLKEPQVAAAPLAKKVQFLESKGLSNDEIKEAMRRAETAGSVDAGSNTQDQVVIPPRPDYMLQQPPPIPQRDWKDYFVMATVSAGVMYGLYECTRRYVLPMILPPTPSALEADKQALDQEFERTEQLLKQLQADTEDMKRQEEARAQTFETVMAEARKVISQLKQHIDDHRQESKLALSNVESLRNIIPKALKQNGETQAKALETLKSELLSLKTLVGRRSASSGPSVPPASAVPSSLPWNPKKSESKSSEVPKSANSKPKELNQEKKTEVVKDTEKEQPFVPDPQSRIPEWQRAASK